jgi:hypothetical protein
MASRSTNNSHNTEAEEESADSSYKPPTTEPDDVELVDIEWAQHPARELLKNAFLSNQIPIDYKKAGGPRGVYDKFKDAVELECMPYDEKFTRRLRDLRDQVIRTLDRKAEDERAYRIFCKNYPTKSHNHLGEPRWEGSEAQRLLKEDMAANLHANQAPQDFRETRAEYQEFTKTTFRGHVHQEKRLWKLHNLLAEKQDNNMDAESDE